MVKLLFFSDKSYLFLLHLASCLKYTTVPRDAADILQPLLAWKFHARESRRRSKVADGAVEWWHPQTFDMRTTEDAVKETKNLSELALTKCNGTREKF